MRYRKQQKMFGKYVHSSRTHTTLKCMKIRILLYIPFAAITMLYRSRNTQASRAVLVSSGLSSACASLRVRILRGLVSALSCVRNTSDCFTCGRAQLQSIDSSLREACFKRSRRRFTCNHRQRVRVQNALKIQQRSITT